MTAAEPQARSLLSKALKQSPDDPALLSALAYIEQKHGATEDARALYEKALAIDPDLVDAATNLGVIEARAGNIGKCDLALAEGIRACTGPKQHRLEPGTRLLRRRESGGSSELYAASAGVQSRSGDSENDAEVPESGPGEVWVLSVCLK